MMLETMRNHAKGWIAKIILGGIALSFVLWGVGDYFTGGNAQPVATINGSPVSNNAFYQAYNRQINSYRAMLGKQYSKDLMNSLNVKDTTLQTMVNRRIMLDIAAQMGLTAPDAVVLATVTNNPSFQSAGAFDAKRYQILTRNMGFGSEQDFENDIRLNVKIEALQQSIMASVQVSEAEIRDRFNREYEQRVLAAIVVDPSSVMDQVRVSEADAKAWYEGHQGNYQSPLRVKVSAVEINPRLLAADMSVDEAEIQAAFDNRVADDKSFAELKDSLRDALLQAAANDEAYKLSQDLDDALGMEDSLKAAAESLNLTLITTDAVSLSKAASTSVLSDAEVRSKAFATLPGQTIEIVETNDGRFIAFEVLERIEPGTLSYVDVAATAKRHAKIDAANQKAREIADEIRHSTGQTLDQLAQQYGQPKYISKPVRSNGVGDTASWLSQSLLDRAFNAASGAWLAQSINVPQGYAAVRIEQINSAPDDDFNSKKDVIRKEVEKAKGAVRFARWMASVRDRYEIVTNARVLDQF